MAKQIDRPTQEQIQRRAHELYLKSGSIPGRDLDNWLEAERQILLAQAKPASPVAEPQAPAELLSTSSPGDRQASQQQRNAPRRRR